MSELVKANEILTHLENRKKLFPKHFFELFPMCKRFVDDIARTKFLLGGNRSSKTTTLADYIVEKMEQGKQRVWACSETFSDSVNVMQRKIWSLAPKPYVTYGRYDEINGFPNRKLKIHDSICTCKSYDQGSMAFASDDIDLIVNDEEPPYAIYREQRMRLLDRNGEMLFAMTSVKGMTDLLMSLYENCDYLETQEAPLLNNEVLPRIAEKNGVKFYFLWTQENPYIDQNRVSEEVKLMDKAEIKSRIYGVPAGVALRVYPSFTKDVHVVKWADIPDDKVTLYHVLDPHDRKPWAMQWWAVHVTGKMYCVWEYPFRKNFNEIEFDDKTYEDYDEVIQETEQGLLEVFGKRVHKRIIDPNFGNSTVTMAVRVQGQSKTTVVKEMAKLGYRSSQKGAFMDGIDDQRTGRLAVKKGLHWAERDGQLVIAPEMYWAEHCMNSIRHMNRFSHGEIETTRGDMRDVAQVKEKYKDFCDTTLYFRTSNPVWVDVNRKRRQETEKVY